ncbi:protein of unknown function DUF456 [Alkalidesulfovibrio alkalitolerans DSM 16529]|jgi:uncharacterized protein YqgC (DUF456 family)|uniref:DUF456 domain-containing protein n=1 Tax=Alkalidesulfovibrio alkalitolerans DSM 16529 TaxID=1121439 RepID=S7T0K2_9BACT|nr:DUF456 domain-containing protein [Alkalidesulfovibrio alkalitolerans]EPR30607.1 protein of unknown function DUF456 [Alkalidesulfovibrio alkalitolerans DSM 16529]
MQELYAALFLGVLFLTLGLHVFSLPGNWVMLALMLVWKYFHPAMDAGWGFFILMALIAGVGELVQFLTQVYSVRRFGGSGRGNWWAIGGSIVGAIVGAPFFFGIGAIPGAFLGAYAGGLAGELSLKRPLPEAHKSAMGAFFGTFLGVVSKFGLGVLMFWMSAKAVWPS